MLGYFADAVSPVTKPCLLSPTQLFLSAVLSFGKRLAVLSLIFSSGTGGASLAEAQEVATT
jgi:hypothetical protein